MSAREPSTRPRFHKSSDSPPKNINPPHEDLTKKSNNRRPSWGTPKVMGSSSSDSGDDSNSSSKRICAEYITTGSPTKSPPQGKRMSGKGVVVKTVGQTQGGLSLSAGRSRRVSIGTAPLSTIPPIMLSLCDAVAKEDVDPLDTKDALSPTHSADLPRKGTRKPKLTLDLTAITSHKTAF